MEVLHMNQRQLANRWGVSEACLERWRSEGIGPQFCGEKPATESAFVDLVQTPLLIPTVAPSLNPFCVVKMLPLSRGKAFHHKNQYGVREFIDRNSPSIWLGIPLLEAQV